MPSIVNPKSPDETKIADEPPPDDVPKQRVAQPNRNRPPVKIVPLLESIPAGSHWAGEFRISHPQQNWISYPVTATVTQSDEEAFTIDVKIEIEENISALWEVDGIIRSGKRKISHARLKRTAPAFDDAIGNRRGTTGAKAISSGDVSLAENALQLYWELAGADADHREIVINLEPADPPPAEPVAAPEPNDAPAPKMKPPVPNDPPKIAREIRLPASEQDAIEAADKKYQDRRTALKTKLVKQTEDTIRKYPKNDLHKGVMQAELEALTSAHQIPLSLLLRKESFVYMESLLEEHEKLKKIYRGAAERLKQADDTRGFEALKAHSKTLPFVVARWDCEFTMKVVPPVPKPNPFAQNNNANQNNALNQITPSDKQFVTLDFYSDSDARTPKPADGFQAFSWAWPKTGSPILGLIHKSNVVQLSKNVNVSIQGNDQSVDWKDGWSLADDGQQIQGVGNWCYDFIGRRVLPDSR